MTTTTTTPHKVKVRCLAYVWEASCLADACTWISISVGPGAWQSAVDKALAHVDETKEQT